MHAAVWCINLDCVKVQVLYMLQMCRKDKPTATLYCRKFYRKIQRKIAKVTSNFGTTVGHFY